MAKKLCLLILLLLIGVSPPVPSKAQSGATCDSPPISCPLTEGCLINSGRGPRIDPISGHLAEHTGIDIPIVQGRDVRATADGRIERVGDQGSTGYGKSVIVRHGSWQNGEFTPSAYSSRYGHLSALLTARGQPVRRGDVIGRSGSTGKSTGPHLHFEYRRNLVPSSFEFLNPLPCLSTPTPPQAPLAGHVKIGDISNENYGTPSVAVEVLVNNVSIGATNLGETKSFEIRVPPGRFLLTTRITQTGPFGGDYYVHATGNFVDSTGSEYIYYIPTHTSASLGRVGDTFTVALYAR